MTGYPRLSPKFNPQIPTITCAVCSTYIFYNIMEAFQVMLIFNRYQIEEHGFRKQELPISTHLV